MNYTEFKAALLTLLGVICFVTMSVLLVFQLHRIQPGPAEVKNEFDSAESRQSGSDNWDKVGLPHDWHMERQNISQLQYRVSFNVTAPSMELYSLYFPVISQNIVVYLNGSEIGNGGSIKEPITRNWPGPLIFPIAPEFLVSGENELLLDVFSEPAGRGLLPVFYFGKWTELVPSYNYRKVLKQTALGTFMVILVAAAFFLFYITWRRNGSSEYAWAGATFLGLSGRLLPVFIPQIPVSAFLWDWWQHVCMGYTVLFILFFVNRFFNLRMRLVETTSLVFIIALSLACFMFGLTHELQSLYFMYGAGVWGLCSLAIGIVPVTVALTNAVGKRSKPGLYIFSVGSVMFALGFHDMLLVNGFITRENGFLVHYSSPLVALLLTTLLISRLIETGEELENLNTSLSHRVDESNKELAATFAKMQKMEHEKILARERERFNRDMHDGLGGHLSTALALAESNMGPDASLTKTIKDATDEMRLMLDTAGAMGEDIGMILGSLRHKLHRQAQAAGFQLVWDIKDVSSVRSLEVGKELDLIRIVQESVNNALRHSGGNVVRVSVYEKNDDVLLEIADNGKCVNLSRETGNGIRNIEKRAKELGALISFTCNSELGGLLVSVRIPIEKSNAT